MDLSKQSGGDRVSLCKKYFIIGSFCLPFLWVVNVIWFSRYAFRVTYDNEEAEKDRKELRRWVMYSGIGSIVWAVILIAWNAYFQMNRTHLDWADGFTYILPVGRA